MANAGPVLLAEVFFILVSLFILLYTFHFDSSCAEALANAIRY